MSEICSFTVSAGEMSEEESIDEERWPLIIFK